MYFERLLTRKHYRTTELLVRKLSKADIAKWLLEVGYFPESNILPPKFEPCNFVLQQKPYHSLDARKRIIWRSLASISYPKSRLTSRNFSIQDPKLYHDIVYYLHLEWDKILDILFSPTNKFYSYSMPIPVSTTEQGALGRLRAGRLIYEWIKMAENDLVVDSNYYRYLARTDIANFYSSVYTHSIAWAVEGRDLSFADKKYELLGNKLDKLMQCSNDGKTNGIPIGSALSDLIAEILLSRIDCEVSRELSGIDFCAVRFKDDYRILAHSEEDAQKILSALALRLGEYNLTLNESKTHVFGLPDGLYRSHERAYFPHSLREKRRISYRTFEHTLLIALDIHRKYPDTSILEKFYSELLTKDKKLKIVFSRSKSRRFEQLLKMISLLLLIKRESTKTLSYALSLIEIAYKDCGELRSDLKPLLKAVIEKELENANRNGSVFEVTWYVFFNIYMELGVDVDLVIKDESMKGNPFVASLIDNVSHLFADSGIELFRCANKFDFERLATRLDVFQRREWLL